MVSCWPVVDGMRRGEETGWGHPMLFERTEKFRETVSRPQVWAAALTIPLPYLGAGNTGGVKTRQTLASRGPPGGRTLGEQRRRRSAAWPHP